MIKLVQVADGVWVVKRRRIVPPRSDLPLPYVISDEMPPTEQVDGKFYTSKAAFRAVGRANGLTEVGNEKFKPKLRESSKAHTKQMRRNALRVAAQKYAAGHRPRNSRST